LLIGAVAELRERHLDGALMVSARRQLS
jgi:hypothetical protein